MGRLAGSQLPENLCVSGLGFILEDEDDLCAWRSGGRGDQASDSPCSLGLHPSWSLSSYVTCHLSLPRMCWSRYMHPSLPDSKARQAEEAEEAEACSPGTRHQNMSGPRG